LNTHTCAFEDLGAAACRHAETTGCTCGAVHAWPLNALTAGLSFVLGCSLGCHHMPTSLLVHFGARHLQKGIHPMHCCMTCSACALAFQHWHACRWTNCESFSALCGCLAVMARGFACTRHGLCA
jgi:hypothetical protein